MHRLAEIVSTKLSEVAPAGKAHPPQAMLLAAIALAHEAEAERGRRESLEQRTAHFLQRVLARVDEVLEHNADPEAADGG